MLLLKYFDKYVDAGLKPIAVHIKHKCPLGDAWNQKWDISRWRPFFEDTSKQYNMGILLGDIVDVEGDTEDANDLIERMIDGVPHPKFRSSKSIHHLFQTPDPELTRIVTGGIEFRGHRHQSVVPPSIHSEGMKYQWLEGSKMPVPKMPEELANFYFNNKKEKKEKIVAYKKPKRRTKVGHTRTECRICKNSFFIHKKRLMLEVRSFQEYDLPWMCHGCREIDMREPCRKLRKNLQTTLVFQ